MVFQAPVLLKWRSVLGNILLPVEFAKLDIAEPHRKGARADQAGRAWKVSKRCIRTSFPAACSNAFRCAAPW